MKETDRFVLRHRGSNDFVTKLPWDFTHCVNGWDAEGMLTFSSEDEAQAAKESDPDGESLLIEEIPVPCA